MNKSDMIWNQIRTRKRNVVKVTTVLMFKKKNNDQSWN